MTPKERMKRLNDEAKRQYGSPAYVQYSKSQGYILRVPIGPHQKSFDCLGDEYYSALAVLESKVAL